MMPDGPAESLSASPPYVHEQQPSPERLVEKCKAGCTKSFELLVQQYEKRIYNFLWQLSGNSHDAEDLTQETFLKAFQSIHRVKSAQAFSTWLFTIAKRTAFNHFRGGKRFQELSADEEVDFEDPSLLLEQKDEAARSRLPRLRRVLQSRTRSHTRPARRRRIPPAIALAVSARQDHGVAGASFSC